MSVGASHKQRVVEVFGQSADTYDEEGESLFPPSARWLVKAAQLGAGNAVLDVATGTGQVLFAAANATGPSGRVVGIDLTEQMLNYARAGIAARGLSNAELRIMDAEHLEFPDAVFDRVLCGFGLFFFPDPQQALRETRRVLQPGGIMGATTFGPNPDMAWQGQLLSSFGLPGNPLVTQPLNTADRVVAAFTVAGFEQIRVTEHDAPMIYADEEAWWRAQWHGGRRATMEAMDEETRARYRVAALDRLQVFHVDGAIRLPRLVLVTTAERAG